MHNVAEISNLRPPSCIPLRNLADRASTPQTTPYYYRARYYDDAPPLLSRNFSTSTIK